MRYILLFYFEAARYIFFLIIFDCNYYEERINS